MIVSGDFVEYEVFLEHVDCILIGMPVPKIELEHLVPENKKMLSKVRGTYLNVQGTNANRKCID